MKTNKCIPCYRNTNLEKIQLRLTAVLSIMCIFSVTDMNLQNTVARDF